MHCSTKHNVDLNHVLLQHFILCILHMVELIHLAYHTRYILGTHYIIYIEHKHFGIDTHTWWFTLNIDISTWFTQ
ncbi:hypothetical protein HanIR_Chr05g0226731 [Helianthus annuus]|nr:hypothetical protein HanIR_Chr05g0226731 [Helianthus annuus]